MIHLVFTLDYEIFGDGSGGLQDLVFEPAERLRALFVRQGLRFVNFVEVAELEIIDEAASDPAIDIVKRQVLEFHSSGFETALHLHPQWYNARHERGQWLLDSSEYNLCRLSRSRIRHLVDRSLGYLRYLVDDPTFTPIAFRAGNWLFQPTEDAAGVLAERGLRIDSSVFKGGVQHRHGMDYRRSMKNGHFWRFQGDVNQPDRAGRLIEVPIYSEMVPPWRMVTTKRVTFSNHGGTSSSIRRRYHRLGEFLRFRYPLKFDFCRMTLQELTAMMERIIRQDQSDPGTIRPVVTIGHTKDLSDIDTVEAFLAYLKSRNISVSTFADLVPLLEHPEATV